MKPATNTNTISCVYVIVFLFFIFSTTETAQYAPPPPAQKQYPYAKFSPSMAIVIFAIVVILFFMGFFSIYVRHCGGRGGAPSIRHALSMRNHRAAAVSRGLEPALIETFPMFQYSEVKTLKIGKGALECAVCLNEFEDSETLRFIPKCDHVFHPDCIDTWLGSHVNCPVCRTNLAPQPGESAILHPPQHAEANGTDPETQTTVDVAIRMAEDDDHCQIKPNHVELCSPSSQQQKESSVRRNFSFTQSRPPRSSSLRRLFDKFKSHSTGHSLANHQGEDMDRFTLRLPEDVRKEMMRRVAHKRAGSLVALPREGSAKSSGYRIGSEFNISNSNSRGRSHRTFERLGRLEVRSDQWIFFATSSARSPKLLTGYTEDSTLSKTPSKGVITAV